MNNTFFCVYKRICRGSRPQKAQNLDSILHPISLQQLACYPMSFGIPVDLSLRALAWLFKERRLACH